MTNREALVLQHVAPEGPALIAEALESAGVGVRIARIDRGEPVPRSVEPFAALVVMGGPMGVYEVDRYPHLRDELRLIEWFLGRGRPILGVCLGSQLLAAALGARVEAGRPEIGWIPVTVAPDAEGDPLFASAPRSFIPLQWHGDAFDLPRGAIRLARSALTENQAFRSGGSAWGLLFHLEATPAHAAGMVAAFPDELQRAGVDGAALSAEASERLGTLAPFSRSALSSWAAIAARAGG